MEMGRTLNPTHKYTREILYHYTCGQCGHWWSYAHTAHKYDIHYPKMLEELTCPHCGYHTTCEEKSGAYPHHEWDRYSRPRGTTRRDYSKGWQPSSMGPDLHVVEDFLETDQ